MDRAGNSSDQSRGVGAIQVDDAMGAIRTKLEALGVLENTIILFIMDHGVLAQTSEPSLFDTGARISMFARYEVPLW